MDMEVVGEEGTAIDDMVIYLKAELYDFCYLQQNAFDPQDCYSPLNRQVPLFALINKIFDSPFRFPTHEEARQYFQSLQNEIKNMNFMPFNSEKYLHAYAKAEELFLTSYISSDKKARPCYSPAPSGYCYSLVSQVDAWIFPSSATTESNHLDYLSAQLSDELQGQRFITQKAHKLMEEINAQEKLIDQRYQMAKQNLAKQHPQGMAYLESVHKSYQEGYKQLAYHKFKASGLLTPEARIKIDPNFKMDTPLPTYKSYNPDQEKFTTKLPNHTNEQSTSSPYQEPRQPAGYLDQARENYSSEETPNYKLKELTIHGDEDNSLFEIISSRYLKKYTDF